MIFFTPHALVPTVTRTRPTRACGQFLALFARRTGNRCAPPRGSTSYIRKQFDFLTLRQRGGLLGGRNFLFFLHPRKSGAFVCFVGHLTEMTDAREVCHHCHQFPKTFLNVSNFLFSNFFKKEVAIVASARKLMKIRRFLLPPPLATAGKFATLLFIFTTISPATRSFRP